MPAPQEGINIIGDGLPQITDVASVLGKSLEAARKLPDNTVENYELPVSVLLAAINFYQAGPNLRKDLRKHVRCYDVTTPQYDASLPGTLTSLDQSLLCLFAECSVEFGPDGYGREYRLLYDPSGPLQVYGDGSFLGATYPARWVLIGSAEESTTGVEVFNSAATSVPQGATRLYTLGGYGRAFEAKQTLNKADFPGNQLPAPTGDASDVYWKEIPLSRPGYVGYQYLGRSVALDLVADVQVTPGRFYSILGQAHIFTVGLPTGNAFDPRALRIGTNGSVESGTYDLATDTFTAGGSGGGGPTYTAGQGIDITGNVISATGGGGGVAGVSSVNTRTGAVTLTKADVGLSNVDNTSDASKPVSTAQQTALNGKVDKEANKGLSTNDYTTAEKTKLAGIATGATANSSDAQLRDRSTHTGAQPINTVTGLQAALDGKAATTHTHTSNQITDFATAAVAAANAAGVGKELTPDQLAGIQAATGLSAADRVALLSDGLTPEQKQQVAALSSPIRAIFNDNSRPYGTTPADIATAGWDDDTLLYLNAVLVSVATPLQWPNNFTLFGFGGILEATQPQTLSSGKLYTTKLAGGAGVWTLPAGNDLYLYDCPSVDLSVYTLAGTLHLGSGCTTVTGSPVISGAGKVVYEGGTAPRDIYAYRQTVQDAVRHTGNTWAGGDLNSYNNAARLSAGAPPAVPDQDSSILVGTADVKHGDTFDAFTWDGTTNTTNAYRFTYGRRNNGTSGWTRIIK